MKRKKLISLPRLNDCGGDINGDWYITYSYRHPKTDKMKPFRIYTGFSDLKTKKARYDHAEIIIKEWTDKLKLGYNPFEDDSTAIYEDQLAYSHIAKFFGNQKKLNKTFNFFASEFLEDIKASVDPDGTLPTYRSKLRTFNAWLQKKDLHEVDITAINNDIILDFFDYMINDLKRSAITIRKYYQILTNVFEPLVKDKKIFENPVYGIPKCTRVNDNTPKPIYFDDINIFKKAIKEDTQLWLVVQFEYYCFLRPGKEIRLLKIEDIDFVRGTVNVSRFRAKTNLQRIVTIPRQFLNELRAKYELMTYPKEFYVIGNERKPGLKPYSKNVIANRFRDVRKRLGMPKEYKLYSWKHTGNVVAADNGIPMRHLQDQNGHASISTTETYMKNKAGKASRQIRDHFPTIGE